MAECLLVWYAEATEQQKRELQKLSNEFAEMLEKKDKQVEWYKEQIEWYKSLVNRLTETEGKSGGRKV